MGLSLRGQTSGAVDINAPAVAGDNTITLPGGNGSANQFYKNSTTAGIVTHSSMVEDSSGNVGINTITFPANGTNLKVSDGTISRLGLDKTGANARSFTIGNSGTILNVYDETADAERLRITSTGNIGINTTIPEHKLTVHTVSTAGYSTATGDTPNTNTLLHLENQNGNDGGGVDNYVAAEFSVGRGATSQGWLGYTRTGDNQGAFFIKQRDAASSYPETIRFPSSGGVTFGGGANTANTLDDYEEGTWTPSFVNGTFTYGSIAGNYVKIGKLVTLNAKIPWTAKSGSGTIVVNLPFTTVSTPDTRYCGSLGYQNGIDLSPGVQLVATMGSNSSEITLFCLIDNNSATTTNVSNMNATGEVQLSVSIIVS